MAMQRVHLVFGSETRVTRVVPVRVEWGRATLQVVDSKLRGRERLIGVIGHLSGKLSPEEAEGMLVLRGEDLSTSGAERRRQAIGLKIIKEGEPGFEEILKRSYFPPDGNKSRITAVTPLLTIGQFERLEEEAPNEMRRGIPEYKRWLGDARNEARARGIPDDKIKDAPMIGLNEKARRLIARLLGMPQVFICGTSADLGPVDSMIPHLVRSRFSNFGVGFAERT